MVVWLSCQHKMDSKTFTRERVECSAKLIEYVQHVSHGITRIQQISHGVCISEERESAISEKINCHSNMNKTKKTNSRKKKKLQNKEKRNMKLILKLMENLDTAPESKITTSSNPIITLDDLCKVRSWLPPDYKYTIVDKEGSFIKQTSCTVLGRTEFGFGTNKKISKQNAAQKILDILQK